MRRQILRASRIDGAEIELAGSLRAAVTTSCRVLRLESAFVASSISKRAVIDTKLKSVSTLYGRVLNSGRLPDDFRSQLAVSFSPLVSARAAAWSGRRRRPRHKE